MNAIAGKLFGMIGQQDRSICDFANRLHCSPADWKFPAPRSDHKRTIRN